MKTTQFHFASFFSFLFFAACAGFLFLIASILGVSALITYLYEDQTNTQAVISFTSQGFMAALLGTAAVISFLKFTNNPSADELSSTSITNLMIAGAMIATGLVLLIGKFTETNQSINWLILPLLTIPASAIPVWLLFRLGSKDLPSQSRWRNWATFGLSISLTPFLLLILEILVIVFVFFIVVIFVVADPELAREFETLASQFRFIDPTSADDAINLFTPYLTRPGVLIPALALFSVIFPMMEEAFKPLGVWLLAGKLTSQAQGFAMGALCGAGFALVETLSVSAQTDDWASLLIARIGTSAMHITTSALIGSGILAAFREKRYLRLLATYLLAVLLHGTWNFLALANSFSAILNTYEQSDLHQTIAMSSGIGLIVLAIALIVILILSNRRLPKPETEDASVITPNDNQAIV